MHIKTKFNDFIKESSEEDDYHMMHRAPTEEDAPMHNLSGTYPDDFYSSKGVRYYGSNSGDGDDYFCWNIVKSARNKPNKPIKIYRTVPDLNKEITKKIKDLQYLLSYHNTHNFFPMGNANVRRISDKYYGGDNDLKYDEIQIRMLGDINNEITELQNSLAPSIKINSGDWVTISRAYAKEHGTSNVSKGYKIISKTVRASQLYTDGNSIQEWGYNV